MNRAGAARRLAAAAVYGGGGLGAVSACLYALLRVEAKVARRIIGTIEGPVPDATGWYGTQRPGPALRIALLGDSTAAGYGVDRVEDTTGAFLGAGVSAATGRRVYVRELGRVGAQSSEMPGQTERALAMRPDVAVILIGGNDVTHAVSPFVSVRSLAEAVASLRESTVEVVVGTCPDLGTIRPIPQPLKRMARSWSRRLAAAQTVATVEAGGRTVSLGSILGPEFDAAPALLFGPDQFHPSAAGYRALASVLIPSVVDALGLGPVPETAQETGVLPISQAAVEAAATTGTELGGTSVAGRERGVRGRWAALRIRRRASQAAAEAPRPQEEPNTPRAGRT